MAVDSADDDLAAYFTDAEELIAAFSAAITTPKLERRLLAIHGVGGVGKSSLLRMFRVQCRDAHVPAALASADDVNTGVGTLSIWAEDLKTDGVDLQEFSKRLDRYLAAQDQVRKNSARTWSNGPVRTFAESAVAGAAGAALGSSFPVVGTVAGLAGGAAMRGSIDWLTRGVSAQDRDLLMSPSRELTNSFVEAASKVAARRRFVLMVDALEKAGGLDAWLSGTIRRLHPNILVVVAGREMLDWDREWPGWMAHARIYRVEPMSKQVMRDLVCRYYRSQLGVDPDPEQVEEIAGFARGLPIAVTTAVRLWVKYQVVEFSQVEAESLNELLRLLLEGVPVEMLDLLRVAAAVRYFDRDILDAIAEHERLDNQYEELKAFPFVGPGREGTGHAYRLHDTVREFIDRALQVDDHVAHRALHSRAARLFEDRISRLEGTPALSEEWQRLQQERVYHLLQVDAEAGSRLLCEVFGACLPYSRYEVCRALLDDATRLQLSDPRALHRLELCRLQLTAAEFSWAYLDEARLLELVRNRSMDASTSWEVLWSYGTYLTFAGRHREAFDYLEKSLDAVREAGLEETAAGCRVLVDLGAMGREHHGGERSDQARLGLLEQALGIARKVGDPFGAYSAYVELGHLHFNRDCYSEAEEMWREALRMAVLSQNPGRIADAHNRLAQALLGSGRFDDAQSELDSAMEAASRLPDTLGGRRDMEKYIRRHLGMLQHARREFGAAIATFSESTKTYRDRKSINGLFRNLVLLAECLYEAGDPSRIKELTAEGDDLAVRSGMGDWVCRWLVLNGNLRLDERALDAGSVAEVAQLYRDALVAGLEWNYRTLDWTAARILWKLSTMTEPDEEGRARAVLTDLADTLWDVQIHGEPISVVLARKRAAEARGSSARKDDADLLFGWSPGLAVPRPRRLPMPWDGL